MSFNFWLSQAFGIIALILVCISYQFNNKAKFLALQILANTFYSASFLALNILVGGINTIVSLIRVAILFLYERKDKSPPIILFISFSLAYILSGIICWQSPLDIIAIISYEIFNIAMFIRSINLTRHPYRQRRISGILPCRNSIGCLASFLTGVLSTILVA